MRSLFGTRMQLGVEIVDLLRVMLRKAVLCLTPAQLTIVSSTYRGTARQHCGCIAPATASLKLLPSNHSSDRQSLSSGSGRSFLMVNLLTAMTSSAFFRLTFDCRQFMKLGSNRTLFNHGDFFGFPCRIKPLRSTRTVDPS